MSRAAPKPFTPKPGRIACCVPFCRRTGKAEPHAEIICGRHWKAADRQLTRTYKKLQREVDRAMEKDPAEYTEAERDRIVAQFRRADAMWAEIKRQAIEAALGTEGTGKGSTR